MQATLVIEPAPIATTYPSTQTEDFPQIPRQGGRAANAAVDRSIQLMNERHHEPLTLQELADCACYSKFHYSRTFRKVTGVSPGRYLTLLRMHRALRLLRSTDLKVIDVATTVGYSSVGTFSTRFRERFGVSPSQCRAEAISGA